MEHNNPDFMNQEPIFPIGVAAKMVGISPSTLRMYEAEGLLIPYKTSTSMRLYSQIDIDWIKQIRKQIKVEKLSVEGIRRLLALIPCWKIKECENTVRAECSAYATNDKPCWTLHDSDGGCRDFECRACEVYRDALKAFETKKMLTKYSDY